MPVTVSEQALSLSALCAACGRRLRPTTWDGTLYDWCPGCDSETPVPIRTVAAPAASRFDAFLKGLAAACLVWMSACSGALTGPESPPPALTQCRYTDTVVSAVGVVVLTGWYTGDTVCEQLRERYPGKVS